MLDGASGRDRLDGDTEVLADHVCDLAGGDAFLSHTVQHGTRRGLLEGQAEETCRIDAVHRRPAARTVAQEAGDALLTSDADDDRDEAVVALTVDRRREPNGRGRLEKAAMELYRECGFDDTTVAEIAERAGLTERTFFRHFADKREILFAGGAELNELVVTTVASAPDAAPPLDASVAGIEAGGAMLQERHGRHFARQRQRIIDASPELRERELHKLAAMAAAVSRALRDRGVGEPGATILGEIAIAIFRISFARWVAESSGPDLTDLIRDALAELRALAAAEPLASARE